MTRDRQFIERLETYLDEYEGPTPLPGAVRHSVRASLATTRQVRPRRHTLPFPQLDFSLPAPLRLGIAAAVVVAAVVIGSALFPRGGVRVGAPDDGAPVASITPAASPSPAALMAQPPGPLAPGPYWIQWAAYNVRLPYRLTVTVPDNWERFDGELPAIIRDGGEAPRGAALSFWTVDNVVADPCHPEDGLVDPPVGDSVDALAEALAAVPGYTVTPPQPATVGGFDGLYLEMTAPEDTAACTDGVLKLWETDGRQFGHGAAQHDSVWIVDVDGVRLVIDAFVNPGTDAVTRGELRAMVNSIQFASR